MLCLNNMPKQLFKNLKIVKFSVCGHSNLSSVVNVIEQIVASRLDLIQIYLNL